MMIGAAPHAVSMVESPAFVFSCYSLSSNAVILRGGSGVGYTRMKELYEIKVRFFQTSSEVIQRDPSLTPASTRPPFGMTI